jgi:uncharacterized protein
MREKWENLMELVRKRYDSHGDPSHDFLHVLRVKATCERIGKAMGADLDRLIPAALLHDVINVPKNHPYRTRASEMAAEEAKEILRQHGYPETECGAISQIISEHSFTRGAKPSSVESAILQDADRLDAIGAIGILRAFTCGCKLGSAYYDVEDFSGKGRPLDDKKFTVDHFFVKLFKLPGMMNTEAGRAEASDRARFMTSFLDRLSAEVQPNSNTYYQLTK